MSRPQPDGSTITEREPEWDVWDRTIVREWLRLKERTCPQCGRPLTLHKQETDEARESGATDPNAAAAGHYGVAALVCPATIALDRAQAKQHDKDKAEIEKGLSPDRARHWLTIREDEPQPTFD